MPSDIQFPNGVRQEVTYKPKDWRLGGVSGVSHEILRPRGSWIDLAPEKEYQIGTYFDTLACVSFSALNCIETLLNFYGAPSNLSDRFLAKLSGTTKEGNYFSTVAETLAKVGAVQEELWPYPRLQRDPPFVWDDYYKEIPQEIQNDGKKFLDKWEINHEWVVPITSDLMQALQLGPVQVSVFAWGKPVDDIYRDTTDIRNHAVELLEGNEGSYWVIFDSYENNFKKLEWDYKFGAAKRFSLTLKSLLKPMPKIVNDTLVQEVEKSGTFGLYLNGKVIVGDEGKLLATWLLRNSGKVEGKTLPLTASDWASLTKVDLKGNPM